MTLRLSLKILWLLLQLERKTKEKEKKKKGADCSSVIRKKGKNWGGTEQCRITTATVFICSLTKHFCWVFKVMFRKGLGVPILWFDYSPVRRLIQNKLKHLFLPTAILCIFVICDSIFCVNAYYKTVFSFFIGLFKMKYALVQTGKKVHNGH